MVNSREELIKEANQLKSEQEKVSFIMNYFLNTVEYDYRYLLIKGYIQESIEEIAPFNMEEDLIENPFKKEKLLLKLNGEERPFDDSYITTTRVSRGYSKLLEEIDTLEKTSQTEEEFYDQLKRLLEQELEKHIDNKMIIEESIEKIIFDLKERKRWGRITSKYFIGKDCKSILIENMLEPDKYMPPLIENSLLKKGVCKHYAAYLNDLLKEIGIKSVIISGTSELGHAWIGAMINDELKSIDLTRAVFIRDHFKNIPRNQTEEDWLIADFQDTFRMQPTRTITGLRKEEDEKEYILKEQMDRNNFDESMIRNYILKQEKKRIK